MIATLSASALAFSVSRPTPSRSVRTWHYDKAFYLRQNYSSTLSSTWQTMPMNINQSVYQFFGTRAHPPGRPSCQPGRASPPLKPASPANNPNPQIQHQARAFWTNSSGLFANSLYPLASHACKMVTAPGSNFRAAGHHPGILSNTQLPQIP